MYVRSLDVELRFLTFQHFGSSKSFPKSRGLSLKGSELFLKCCKILQRTVTLKEVKDASSASVELSRATFTLCDFSLYLRYLLC